VNYKSTAAESTRIVQGFASSIVRMKERRQKLMIQNNERENAKHTPHTYQQGDQVMILQYQHRKSWLGIPEFRRITRIPESSGKIIPE
jgi:hypothetical protein